MIDTSSRLALICALSLGQFACSAGGSAGGASSAGGSTGHGGGSGGTTQAGGASQAAGSSAGTTNAAGGAASGGASGSSSSTAGANVGGGAPAGGALGSAGSVGSGGVGGAAPSCTPGTGTVPVGAKSELDQKTCLTWTTDRTATTLTNKQATKYCDGLTQDGISDWRVPHPEELVTCPGLVTDSTAYITGPTYIPNGATAMDGCTGDSHSCNIAKYNDTSVTCGWQGVGFAGWVVCVSGTATAGTTNSAYAAASCSPCNSELASFTETDCLPYAN